ncbi:MAG: hypothetical protein LLF76_06945 [Planctomycetaceae bacterium]|nr:hypothetical protein [Planctomycetaceae bacterium]
MKYIFISMVCLVCLGLWGCQRGRMQETPQQRAALIEQLQRDYPATWQEKLAEHDREMERIRSVTPAPSYGPGYAPDPDIPNQPSPWAFPDIKAE